MACKDNKKMTDNFFPKDFTQRREAKKNAEEEKKNGLRNPLKQKLSYPEAQMYNREFANNNFASLESLRLCVKSSRYNPIALILLLLLFLSCQTIPKTAGAFFENASFLPLESGASIYLFASVKEARPIIDILPIEELNDRQTKQMLDRTGFLAAAMFPKESGRRFQIAAFGNYPSSQADFAFSVNSGWQKQNSQAGGSYWYSPSNRLSIAMNRRQAFISASLKNEPSDPITQAPGAKIPEGFQGFCGSSPLSCWLENPGPVINRILSNAGVPLRSPIKGLFINLFPTLEKKYEAVIRLQFENTSHARGMAAILNLASGLAPNEIAAFFFANPPVQNGSNIDIKSAPLGETEIAALFRLFGAF